MDGWKTEHSKTDFVATLMQIILVYYLWARVNQHPPTHHEGWMNSGSPRTHYGLFKWVFVFENVSQAEFSLLQFRDFINSKEIPDTFVRFLNLKSISTLEKEPIRLFLGLRIQPPQIQKELQYVPYTLQKAPHEILEVYLEDTL